MKKVKFYYYQRLNGHIEFQEYLDSLSEKEAAKLIDKISKVEKIGLYEAIRKKYVKKLDKSIFEIRTRYKNNQYRGLYFHIEENNYFITHGFTKKRMKTPLKEIIHAHKLRKEFLQRRKKDD